jgi:hypothetical protein
MVDITPEFNTTINFAAFLAFFIVGGLQIYAGRSTHPEKKVTFAWVNLSFGTFLLGFNYLMQALFVTELPSNPAITISSYLLVMGGAALSFTSFLMLYMESSDEAKRLRERQEDLQEITARLKKKYLSRELPEDEMKRLDTDIVKELAEIEVKLDKINRKKPAKS